MHGITESTLMRKVDTSTGVHLGLLLIIKCNVTSIFDIWDEVITQEKTTASWNNHVINNH